MTTGALTGRIAVVTGAGRGIGEATAVALSRLGAQIVLAARTETELERVAEAIEANGGTALAVPTDVTRTESVERLVSASLDRFGRIDILVNNAGSAVFEPVESSDPDAWWRTVEVNLHGTYLCTRYALPSMLEQGSGHVVNVLSVAAETPFPASSAYCGAKAGALMMTRVLAGEVRRRGIRVTAILPGSTRTPFWKGMEFTPDLSEMMPPERVAETVVFAVTQPGGAVIDEVRVMPPFGVL
ncbi:SDR family oxidoreductase [Candidatus Poribacteria bacterium]|nr:SDR family oxidoreductase [Candidatus Poribacteria bacterium]